MSPSHFRTGRVAADPRIRKPSRLRIQAIAGAGAVLLVVLTAGTGMVPDAAFAAPAKSASVAAAPDFGPNVRIFDPSMPVADIQAAVDAVTATQVNDEMGPNRYSLLFKPGTHGSAEEPLIIQVGYQAEVAGPGRSPTDVTINGHVDVYNRCREATGCFSLDSFWRSVSNLTINVTGLDGCRAGTNFQAASKAAPTRRLHRRFQDRRYHQRPSAAISGSRQQQRCLVERSVEPGVRRGAGRAGAVAYCAPRTPHSLRA